MKALVKLSVLLALIVAGRFLRPATTAESVTVTTASPTLLKSEAAQFTSLNDIQTAPALPVQQRTTAPKEQPIPDSPVWF